MATIFFQIILCLPVMYPCIKFNDVLYIMWVFIIAESMGNSQITQQYPQNLPNISCFKCKSLSKCTQTIIVGMIIDKIHPNKLLHVNSVAWKYNMMHLVCYYQIFYYHSRAAGTIQTGQAKTGPSFSALCWVMVVYFYVSHGKKSSDNKTHMQCNQVSVHTNSSSNELPKVFVYLWY